jgi:hypothetical protein
MVSTKPASAETSKPRRPYTSPCLSELGDLRTLTLGGSPGANDSGMGDPRRPLVIGEAPFPPFDRST